MVIGNIVMLTFLHTKERWYANLPDSLQLFIVQINIKDIHNIIYIYIEKRRKQTIFNLMCNCNV